MGSLIDDNTHGFLLRRLALLYIILCTVYSLTLYTSKVVGGDSLFNLTVISSLFTPILAWVFISHYTRAQRIDGGLTKPRVTLGSLYYTLIPPSTILLSFLLVLVMLNPFLLSNALVWMHIIIISLQAMYHTILIWVLSDLLELGTWGRRIAAVGIFVAYPLLMVLSVFGGEAGYPEEIMSSRMLLMFSYPAMVFSPDLRPPVESKDYSYMTFAISMLFMTLAITLGLALLKTARKPGGGYYRATIDYRGVVGLIVILVVTSVIIGVGIYTHAYVTDKAYPVWPKSLLVIGATQEGLHTIGLASVPSRINQSNYPLVLRESDYNLDIKWYYGEPPQPDEVQDGVRKACKVYVVDEDSWRYVLKTVYYKTHNLGNRMHIATINETKAILDALSSGQLEELECNTTLRNLHGEKPLYIVWVATVDVKTIQLNVEVSPGVRKKLTGEDILELFNDAEFREETTKLLHDITWHTGVVGIVKYHEISYTPLPLAVHASSIAAIIILILSRKLA
ncbi:MAG: hypothetical protein GSR85_07715 [Desulfurococcales archaeon]|nr:hypothetical protein [Desulfurococcales archaeon]